MSKLMNRQRGFTLIELLIVIAIIGIIAAILIPNFLDSLQKAKQKRSMGDMRNTGEAWFAWLTDLYGGAAAAGQSQQVSLPASYAWSSVVDDLQPQYIQEVKKTDAWSWELDYCRPATIQEVKKAAQGTIALAIISPGRDGTNTANCGAAVTSGAFDPTDYDQDIVWADGFFTRYPQKGS